jgi:hypothetical protein
LLDHTLILYGGGMSDSNAHSHNSLPLLLVAGNASGVQAGRHLKYGGAPSPNLLLAILEKLGMPLDRIGTSNGTLGI